MTAEKYIHFNIVLIINNVMFHIELIIMVMNVNYGKMYLGSVSFVSHLVRQILYE